MMNLSAAALDFKALNEQVRVSAEDILIDDCCGQRFIGTGLKEKRIIVNGTPGNALGAYLDGASIYVNGNAQDAVGDTMNDGKIVIYGNAGDALGYAMRGGGIFVRGNVGYRTGIHMKEYQEKKPVIVVGGFAGSFLGEYLAGGIIVVLGLNSKSIPVGNFTGTGMHGGKIFIRTAQTLDNLPDQVLASVATPEELLEIAPYITQFSDYFGTDTDSIMKDRFYLLRPNAKNPYKQLYVAN